MYIKINKVVFIAEAHYTAIPKIYTTYKRSEAIHCNNQQFILESSNDISETTNHRHVMV